MARNSRAHADNWPLLPCTLMISDHLHHPPCYSPFRCRSIHPPSPP